MAETFTEQGLIHILNTSLRQQTQTVTSPRLKRRGPIEASCSAARAAFSSAVSTPEKAWPH